MCMDNSKTSISTDGQMPCHGVALQEEKINCQHDNCQCSDLCTQVVSYHLEINEKLKSFSLLTSFFIDFSISKLPEKVISPLIRPPIFS